MSEAILFLRQISRLLKAGLPLVKALEIIRSQAQNRFASALDQIIGDVTSGVSFSESISKHKRYFGKDIVSMVYAGEKSGFLEDALFESSKYLAEMSSFRSRIKSSLSYPAVVLAASFASLLMIILVVLPMFVSIFEGMDFNLPISAVFLLGISKFIGSNFLALIFFVAVMILLLKRFLKTGLYEFMILQTPLIRNIYIELNVSKICRIFGMLIRQGVPVVDAMEILYECCSSKTFKDAIFAARQQIEVGRKIAVALSCGKLFPKPMLAMVDVGEETGKLGEILLEAADFYEGQTEKSLKFVCSAAEPAATIAVGLVVLTIVYSVFAPMAQLIASIQ